MIYFQRNWRGPAWAEPDRALASLGLFAGRAAPAERNDQFVAAVHDPVQARRPGASRSKNATSWRAQRSPSGLVVLLSGEIDNRDELAELLGLQGSAETLYGAAVERWGDDADARVIGSYASVMMLADGSVRLSRSPWNGNALLFHSGPDVLLVGSVPRVLFAAGLPKELDPATLARMIAFEIPELEKGNFKGIETIPVGSILHVNAQGRRLVRWYDPVAVTAIRYRRDEDYVEAANELLARSARAALSHSRKPAVALSGGLDSSLVADELLRQMPADRRLASFTFTPLPEWDGVGPPQWFHDDRPYVEAYAAMHPRLDATFVDNRGIDFFDRVDKLMLAGDAGYVAQVMGSVHHGVYDAARDAGCDWLFSGDMGNFGFSCGPPWAYAEFFRKCQWRQLWKLCASRVADPRPMARRLVATGLMPNLPPGLARRLRDRIHGERDHRVANQYLSSDGALAAKRHGAELVDAVTDFDGFVSHERCVRDMHDSSGVGSEYGHAKEEVFGIRLRDVLGWRPILEFCAGLPTRQFAWDGEDRRLARRMAVGRMPEAQRLERRHGQHNSDWHLRMTGKLDVLREEVERIAAHPELASLIDTRRMMADLDAWPKAHPSDMTHVDRLRFALPGVIRVRQYYDHATGRNVSATASSLAQGQDG